MQIRWQNQTIELYEKQFKSTNVQDNMIRQVAMLETMNNLKTRINANNRGNQHQDERVSPAESNHRGINKPPSRSAMDRHTITRYEAPNLTTSRGQRLVVQSHTERPRLRQRAEITVCRSSPRAMVTSFEPSKDISTKTHHSRMSLDQDTTSVGKLGLHRYRRLPTSTTQRRQV